VGLRDVVVCWVVAVGALALWVVGSEVARVEGRSESCCLSCGRFVYSMVGRCLSGDYIVASSARAAIRAMDLVGWK
jgi:hypothetical protein